MSIDGLLVEEGWEDDIFEDSSDDDDDDDSASEIARIPVLNCSCNINQIHISAGELKSYFEMYPSRFPRDDSQLDSFTALGGWAHGSWSRYVNAAVSMPNAELQGGFIHLHGCYLKGHSARVYVDENGVLSIRADKPDLELEQRQPFKVPYWMTILDKMRARENNLEKEEDRITREEKLYDERTFGSLDDTPESEYTDDVDAVKIFKEELASDAEISSYLSAGLSSEEVYQLARLMPKGEVLRWAEEFGPNSITALELLNIGLGALTRLEDIEDINFDEARASIAQAIRMAIRSEFDKYEPYFRFIDKTPKKDEEEDLMNLDDDEDWDDDEDLDEEE